MQQKNFIIERKKIRKVGKPEELAHLFSKHKLDLIGIVDQKIVHEDETIRTKEFDNCVLITSSAWRTDNGASCGGVGMLVKERYREDIS